MIVQVHFCTTLGKNNVTGLRPDLQGVRPLALSQFQKFCQFCSKFWRNSRFFGRDASPKKVFTLMCDFPKVPYGSTLGLYFQKVRLEFRTSLMFIFSTQIRKASYGPAPSTLQTIGLRFDQKASS